MEKNNILTEDKKTLRKRILAALPFIEGREEKERKVTSLCLALVDKIGAKKVGVYLSGKGELSTDMLIEELFLWNVRVFVPVVTGESEMFFTEIKKGDVFHLNRFGLREPEITTTEENFDVLFVPLSAFDENFHRLGKGKGYYDRFLQGKTFLKIGLAFLEQKVKTVPCEETDIPLDSVFYA